MAITPLSPSKKQSPTTDCATPRPSLPSPDSGRQRNQYVASSIVAVVALLLVLLHLQGYCAPLRDQRLRLMASWNFANKGAARPGDGAVAESLAAAEDARGGVADFFEKAGNFHCNSDRQFTVEEVARHASEDDLWIVIDGNVLDVSSFVSQHPGGSVLLDGAGGEDMATVFARFHHPSSVPLLEIFCIGRIRGDGD